MIREYHKNRTYACSKILKCVDYVQIYGSIYFILQSIRNFYKISAILYSIDTI